MSQAHQLSTESASKRIDTAITQQFNLDFLATKSQALMHQKVALGGSIDGRFDVDYGIEVVLR